MKRPAILDEDVVVVPREHTFEAWNAMLSASPHASAWADVKAYVEGLERERDDMRLSSQNSADWASQAITDMKAAEACISELEARLKEAERVIAPFAKVQTAEGLSNGFLRVRDDHPMVLNDNSTTITMGDFRAARTWMEGKK